VSRAVLGLGSNLGDRAAHLRAAVGALADAVLAVSGVYETPPWGDPDQPDYLNAVALVQGRPSGAAKQAARSSVPNGEELAPDAYARHWLTVARELEEKAGRHRDPGRRFGPRTLDVDVIAAWTADGIPVTMNDADLTLPHPRAHLRAFVLRPWLDIQPYAQVPGRGFVFDLLRAEPLATDAAGLRARDDISLET
jgi:2-amino-4-hydroxy-6-hydroxymethyldihydropteridine diphosphokinase